ncbi:unannotated protein [freshwater metagenome]|jgi:hypothetical protein|uniref:Unannotated protein n=1 Tax=freshwater metagenome TaxID=449393 RepID=A0A6J6G756_9ZZZZ|nr:hypothetical protein [Actinomycetota bacterium]
MIRVSVEISQVEVGNWFASGILPIEGESSAFQTGDTSLDNLRVRYVDAIKWATSTDEIEFVEVFVNQNQHT